MGKPVMSGRRGSAAAFAPHIGWIVEEGTVRVFHVQEGELFRLGYPEAAVWDLIGRYSREADIIPKLAVICDVNAVGARRLLRACLRRWTRAGVLLSAESHG